MRSFATVLPQFWTGKTGKAITAAGKDARIMATYLLTCEHTNMLGLYRLPLLYAAEETGLKRREVAEALKQLHAVSFSQYDEPTEFVWVLEMARFQLGLLPGEALKEGDKRTKGAARIYRQISPNPFLGLFHDRYSEVLGLSIRRDFLSETQPHPSPSEGASEPLTRGYGPDPGLVPVPVRKGDPGETRDSAPSLAGLSPEEVHKRWNEISGVKQCKALGVTIRARILARLKEHPDLSWWTALFLRVQASDFLCGRTNGKKGPFRASLDWILGKENLDKILAGNYDSSPDDRSPVPTCTKQIQRGNFLKPCGALAAAGSRPDEPRCVEHVAGGMERNANAAH